MLADCMYLQEDLPFCSENSALKIRRDKRYVHFENKWNGFACSREVGGCCIAACAGSACCMRKLWRWCAATDRKNVGDTVCRLQYSLPHHGTGDRSGIL